MDSVVSTAVSVILGIWLVNMMSSAFLGIDFIEIIKDFLRKDD